MLAWLKIIWDWIVQNKEWIFDGIGVVLVTSLLAFLGNVFLRKAKETSNQIQTSGDNSTNFQAGRDIKVSRKKEENNVRKKKPNKR